MTVQEIQEIGFEKAVFGGYDMKSVDTFLERVAEEFAAMQKENAAMKAKMKVLVVLISRFMIWCLMKAPKILRSASSIGMSGSWTGIAENPPKIGR